MKSKQTVKQEKKGTSKPSKTVSVLKKTVTSYSKAADGSTKTVYPKNVSSMGKGRKLVSQMTKYTTPMKKQIK
jgi:hypothetical protein